MLSAMHSRCKREKVGGWSIKICLLTKLCKSQRWAMKNKEAILTQRQTGPQHQTAVIVSLEEIAHHEGRDFKTKKQRGSTRSRSRRSNEKRGRKRCQSMSRKG